MRDASRKDAIMAFTVCGRYIYCLYSDTYNGLIDTYNGLIERQMTESCNALELLP